MRRRSHANMTGLRKPIRFIETDFVEKAWKTVANRNEWLAKNGNT